MDRTGRDRKVLSENTKVELDYGEPNVTAIDEQQKLPRRRRTPAPKSAGVVRDPKWTSERMELGVAEEITLGGEALGPQCPEPIRPPLVSFVLRNWNYANYVGAAIDSIKNQDYSRFEAIVVDNGSTDDSREVIAQHVDNDPRFTVIYLEENFGPLGGALRGLDAAKGEFVTFVDSDDYLLPNFASYHVQVHLAAKRNVAFTTSNLIEIGDDGSILSGSRGSLKRLWEQERRGLRSSRSVPRLRTVSDEAYERFSRTVFNYEPKESGWLWAPGTANMYRRFMLQMLRPVGAPDRMRKLAIDGHYNRLAHLFGGSILIDEHLSAYRIHNSNIFSQSASVSSLRNGGGPATEYLDIRRCEAIRVLFVQSKDKVWRLGGQRRYWAALKELMNADVTSPWVTAEHPEFQQTAAEYFPQLVEAFGATATIKNLMPYTGIAALRTIARMAYPTGMPMPIRVRLFQGTLSQKTAMFRSIFSKR